MAPWGVRRASAPSAFPVLPLVCAGGTPAPGGKPPRSRGSKRGMWVGVRPGSCPPPPPQPGSCGRPDADRSGGLCCGVPAVGTPSPQPASPRCSGSSAECSCAGTALPRGRGILPPLLLPFPPGAAQLPADGRAQAGAAPQPPGPALAHRHLDGLRAAGPPAAPRGPT